MPHPRLTYPEHAEDVLGQWLDWREDGKAALVIVTATEGGAVRAPGALMSVSPAGDRAGYISGGCIDADVALQAAAALADGAARHLRYGAGSPFTDLPLPCGGAIDLTILPDADHGTLQQAHADLVARRPVVLDLAGMEGFRPRYVPKLRLRIAGRGADCLALARVAEAAGISTHLQLPDTGDLFAAKAQGAASITTLKTPSEIPPASDDPWTGFVLMFHDTDWELPLLQQALDGPACYIGAVGSKATHAKRGKVLQEHGIVTVQIRRVRGPIGIVPSMRDASMLAVSVLAEIVEAYHDAVRTPFSKTALIMLAAGQAQRFRGDKLLASLKGEPLAAHAARALASEMVAARVAVTGPGDRGRNEMFAGAGWQTVTNPHASNGQATSLAAGIRAVEASGAESALILLADMPKVGDDHLRALLADFRLGRTAVMSEAGRVLCPPAIFDRSVFPALTNLTGDEGAKSLFLSLADTSTVTMPAHEAMDVDTRADLERAEGLAHA